MYGKEEAKALRKRFWTSFGRYMQQFRSARGPKQKWLNYKTGVPHVFFRLHADNRLTSIGIEIQHPDPGIRDLFYQQFEELKMLLESSLEEEWVWEPHYFLETGKEIARIYTERRGWNLYEDQYWSEMFPWLGRRLVALDEIWADAKIIFEDLSD